MSATSTAQRKTESPLAGYVPVQVAMFRRLRTAPVDLFVHIERDRPLTLYCREGCPWEQQKLFGLADAGIEEIYVRSDDFQQFGTSLLEAVESQNELGEVPRSERFAALQLAVAVEVEHTTRLIDSSKYVSLADRIGRSLTSLLAANDVLPRDLFQMARHDFNTFTHVTNVASYAVILAERIGICDDDQLEQVATGAMLHDIGKRFIPANILTKPARLDPPERMIIETHPQRGYEELCRRLDVNVDQLMMVYQHHERIDGSGYPVGVMADEIHPWAKLLAVVDVFDAMTGRRPYRRPASARDAIDYILKNAGTHFDREVAQCWCAAMTKA